MIVNAESSREQRFDTRTFGTGEGEPSNAGTSQAWRAAGVRNGALDTRLRVPPGVGRMDERRASNPPWPPKIPSLRQFNRSQLETERPD
jgi:hypothetical protein